MKAAYCWRPSGAITVSGYHEDPLGLKLTRTTDYGAWQRMGETCDTIVMMGLHQEKKVDQNTSFMLCEIQKRLFNVTYAHDKSQAMFLGM